MKKEEPAKRVDISTSSSMQQSQKRQWTVDPVTNKPQTSTSQPRAQETTPVKEPVQKEEEKKGAKP